MTSHISDIGNATYACITDFALDIRLLLSTTREQITLLQARSVLLLETVSLTRRFRPLSCAAHTYKVNIMTVRACVAAEDEESPNNTDSPNHYANDARSSSLSGQAGGYACHVDCLPPFYGTKILTRLSRKR